MCYDIITRMASKQRERFAVHCTGDKIKKNLVFDKIERIRNLVQPNSDHRVENTELLDTVLDFYLRRNTANTAWINTYVPVDKNNTDQQLFITSQDSVQKIIDLGAHHSQVCSSRLTVSNIIMRGHVAVTKLKCSQHHSAHEYKWSSSPYLPNGEFLVNSRVFHGFSCSGMLPIHYKRLSSGANIGMISDAKRKEYMNKYFPCVEKLGEESQMEALMLEIGSYEGLDEEVEVSDEEGEPMQIQRHPGIDIATDARHGWRKNSKDTSVVAVGYKTQRVIKHVHVTKADDPVSQRHEIFGTRKVYEYINNNGSYVNIHTHDRQPAVNKFGRENAMINQDDPWHGIKSLKKTVKSICKGPKYKHGRTWHTELEDKLEPVATHCHFAAKQCGGDPAVLRARMDNIVPHYKNDHRNCHNTSRCRTDPNYEPSCVVITSPVAETLLTKALKNSLLYKFAEEYCWARDTFSVESFNNVMNVFQDKRIAFSDKQYQMRAFLAVLHWNCNVERGHTSIWNPRDARAPRRQKGKKVYKKYNYSYRDAIWSELMATLNWH